MGTRCTARIQIEGKEVNCLLDTGLQVTTIPKSYYERYLSRHPMKSLENLLELEGANGQVVPYLGYVELNLKFPKDFLGMEAEVPTMALIPFLMYHKFSLEQIYLMRFMPIALKEKPLLASHSSMVIKLS